MNPRSGSRDLENGASILRLVCRPVALQCENVGPECPIALSTDAFWATWRLPARLVGYRAAIQTAERKTDRLKPVLLFADKQSMNDKRAEPRTPLMARVDVLWTDEQGSPRVAPGSLEDRSHGGLSIRLKAPIPIGSHVTVRRGSEELSGTVTYSRPYKEGHVIGIQRLFGAGGGGA
jgi:hypothetical protein